jgi:putative copper resistance protein D
VTPARVIDPLIQVLVRSVHMAATLLASGTVCFSLLVANIPALRGRLKLMVWCALAVVIISGFGWLLLLTAEIFGAPIVEVCRDGGVWQVVTDTRFGLVWCVRLLLAILLGVLVPWPATRALQLVIAALLAALLDLISHAGATPGFSGRIHLASDMVHLLAAGAWLGALPAFVLLLASARRSGGPVWSAFTIDATRRFSLLAIASVAALLASGTINSSNLLAAPRDLLTTDYGRLLLCKIGLFGAMVCIAAINRYHLTARLPEPAAIWELARNSLCETGLGLCVLLLVGALGTMPPTAHVHTLGPNIPADAAFVHIHTAEAMADVTIDPGRVGTVSAEIRLSREDFSQLFAKEVTLALASPDAGSKSIERSAVRMPDGTWTIDRFEIGNSGIWTVRIIIAPEAGKPIVLDAPVVIER